MNEPKDVVAAVVAGVTGAICVNVIHELTRRVTPDAPRMDIVGMRAFRAISEAAGFQPTEHLRTATFAADIVANSLFYGLVAAVDPENALVTGAALGSAAGVGGVLLPGPMGLGQTEVNRTPMTQALVIGMYLAGGLVAGAVYSKLAHSD